MRAAWWSAIAMIALAMPCSAQLRAVLDTSQVLPQLRRADEVRASRTLITRPFVGDLQVTLVRRGGGREMLEPITSANLAALRLTRDQAFALATRNLRALLQPYSIEMPDASPEMSDLRSVEGELLAASRLLLTDDWRSAAEALGGPLVAAVPTASSLIFGRDTMTAINRRKSIPAPQYLELALGVLMGYTRRDERLSMTVLRWDGTAWHALPPMTEVERAALQRGGQQEASGDAPTHVTAPATPAPTLPATDAAPPAKTSKPVTTKAKPSKP